MILNHLKDYWLVIAFAMLFAWTAIAALSDDDTGEPYQSNGPIAWGRMADERLAPNMQASRQQPSLTTRFRAPEYPTVAEQRARPMRAD